MTGRYKLLRSIACLAKVQGAHSTQTFISQRIAFAENSAELPPDVDTLTSEVTKVRCRDFQHESAVRRHKAACALSRTTTQ